VIRGDSVFVLRKESCAYLIVKCVVRRVGRVWVTVSDEQYPNGWVRFSRVNGGAEHGGSILFTTRLSAADWLLCVDRANAATGGKP